MYKIESDSDFSIYNLPFGIFSLNDKERKVGIAYGDSLIDITQAVEDNVFQNIPIECLNTGRLNEFISLGKSITNGLRNEVRFMIESEQAILKQYFIKQESVTMHLPIRIGDYTDFYSSEEHARNVGKLYRDPENALMPNWKHLPVAYHGRASSVVVDGTTVVRPSGQVKPSKDVKPSFGPSKALDFELETGFIIGKENQLGDAISIENAEEYIFGMVLLNDWSARDIQKWEYVPLGPFLGKNFATSISPWVIPYEALKDFHVKGPVQDPPVQDYLKIEGDKNIDIKLEVKINDTLVSRSNFKYMYWNMMQQVAHHSVNGCNLRIGDLMGSGTISGKDNASLGSLLEITEGGKKEIVLNDGSSRTFLEDYDVVSISGYCEKNGKRVGFGSVRGRVLPAKTKQDGKN